VRSAVVDFPIKRLLDEMRTEFTYHTETEGFDWRVVPSSLTVRSDPRLLEQIIRNLLSNAVKYTSKGKLLLGCRRRGANLRIAAPISALRSGTPATVSQSSSSRRSLRNSISLKIPHGNEAKALV